MTTSRLRFFMRLKEFEPLVWGQAENLGVSIVLVPHIPQPCEVAVQPSTLNLLNGDRAWRIYFAANLPESLPDANGIKPVLWGWLQMDVPQEDKGILYMVNIVAGSDWWDQERSRRMENPASLQIFREVSRSFRKKLNYPTWVYNVNEMNLPPRIRRDVGYSDGAAEWFNTGGQLHQSGATYIRYSINGEYMV